LTLPLPNCGERYDEGLGALNPNEPIKRKPYHSFAKALGSVTRAISPCGL
jgi:hypothetical protein